MVLQVTHTDREPRTPLALKFGFSLVQVRARGGNKGGEGGGTKEEEGLTQAMGDEAEQVRA